jgi:hypothetical protein
MQSNPGIQNTPVYRREEWPVRPEELFAELAQPGRGRIPAILPVIDPSRTPGFVNCDADAVTADQLTSLYLKIAPVLDTMFAARLSIAFSDEPHWISWIHRAAAERMPVSYALFEGRSLKFLRLSQSDFIDDIAAQRRSAGIGDGDVERLADARHGRPYEGFRARFGELALTVYRALREAGYSHRDIIG